jgi:hypothetical protein
MECGSGERFLEPSHEVFKSLNLQLFGAVSGASFVKANLLCAVHPLLSWDHFYFPTNEEEKPMNPIKTHVAGVDVHKRHFGDYSDDWPRRRRAED